MGCKPASPFKVWSLLDWVSGSLPDPARSKRNNVQHTSADVSGKGRSKRGQTNDIYSRVPCTAVHISLLIYGPFLLTKGAVLTIQIPPNSESESELELGLEHGQLAPRARSEIDYHGYSLGAVDVTG